MFVSYNTERSALESYRAHLDTKQRAPRTRTATMGDLRQFVTWWEAHTRRAFDPALLRTVDVLTWMSYCQEQKQAAPASINRALASLRGFCAYCVQQGWMTENVVADIRPVAQEPEGPRFLPDAAVNALLREVRRQPDQPRRLRDEAALVLLVYGGLRVQEVCDVQLRDLDLDGGVVVVRKGKGGKHRRVPLHPEAVRALRRFLAEVRCPAGVPPVGSNGEQAVLLMGWSRTGSERAARVGVTPRLIQRMVAGYGTQAARRLEQEAKQEPSMTRVAELHELARRLAAVTPHMLRHSLARRMLHSGAQLTEVRAVLGHSRMETTSRYLTATQDDLREAVERAGV
jgi:site-specific recombinase XerD